MPRCRKPWTLCLSLAASCTLPCWHGIQPGEIFIAQANRILIDQGYTARNFAGDQLLELFARTPGKTFTRDEILNHLKGIETSILSRSVDILVSRLRQKLKPLALIKTLRGSGYLFVGKTR